jgi:hypothetical protein
VCKALFLSRTVHLHDQEAFRTATQETSDISGDSWRHKYNKFHRLVRPLYSCWVDWQDLLAIIGRSSGRDRAFYDNLAFWIFRHCVVARKMYLLDVVKTGDCISKAFECRYVPGAYDRLAYWDNPPSYQYRHKDGSLPDTRWEAAPTSARYLVDYVQIQFHSQPTLYLRYRMSRDDEHGTTGVGTLFCRRNDQALVEGEGQQPFLKLCAVMVMFNNGTAKTFEKHLACMTAYVTANDSVPVSSSFMDYRCRFVEMELRAGIAVTEAAEVPETTPRTEIFTTLCDEAIKIEHVKQTWIYDELAAM